MPAQVICLKNCTRCDVSAVGLPHALIVQCRFLDDSLTGFQVIVQSTNASEVHKLYLYQSMDLHTTVIILVERDGNYKVSIFGIREGMGILGFYVQYTMVVTVGDASHESGIANSHKTNMYTEPDKGYNQQTVLL